MLPVPSLKIKKTPRKSQCVDENGEEENKVGDEHEEEYEDEE